MCTVLLLVVIDAHFVELSRVARALNASGKYKPILWFLSSYPVISRDIETCRSEGWQFHASFSISRSRPFSSVFLKKLILSKFPRKVLSLYLLFGNFLRMLFASKKAIQLLVKETNTLIQQYKPCLLIVCEENAGYATHIPIRICEADNVPTVIVPYTIADATEAAEYFYDVFEHQVTGNLINQIVARKYPHWIYEYRDRKLLRLPAAMIINLEKAGYGLDNPWVLNSDNTGMIAVENRHMFNLYRKVNLPEERLIITGAFYDDVLAGSFKKAREARDRFIRELSLQKEFPILLCAMPPSQFPRDCEFLDYDSLVSFWMESLKLIPEWNIVIRPHPRLTDDQVGLLRRFGLKICDWDTASLVPLCDLYVASVSATIRWAIACGKPVINYDVYQMRYKDYQDTKGVVTVFEKENFQEVLTRMCTDRAYYQQIRHFQEQDMERWGILDGKSSERILKLFDDVIAGRLGRKAA